MPHMLAAEHMGIVQALNYGTARNDATLAAALAGIGAQVAKLVLTKDGDGVWTLNNPWTIPANVILEVPYGAYVGGTGAGTINGGLITYDNAWNLGPPLAGFGSTPIFQTNSLQTVYVVAGETTATPQALVHVRGNTGRPASLMVEEGWDGTTGSHGGGATINWKQLNAIRASLGVQFGGTDLTLNMQGGVRLVIGGAGANHVGIGMTPTVQFELSGSVGQKATGTTWSNPCDTRIKNVQRPFTEGRELVNRFRAYWVKFNGLAGTNADLPEFVAPLAQEVQAYAPHMVGTYEALLHPTDTEPTQMYNFDASTLIYALVNTVQEHDALLVDLTTRLAALEALTGERADALEAAAHTHGVSGNAGTVVPYAPGGQEAHASPAARKKRSHD